MLTLTRSFPAPVLAPACPGLPVAYRAVRIQVIEGEVDLPPARWTLSINGDYRQSDVVNLPQSVNQSIHVTATLDNSTGLINSSPKFTSHHLIQLVGNQSARHSLSTFDSEGDSLTYALVRPVSKPDPMQACGVVAAGSTVAPHLLSILLPASC
jgi:hypothetical protein